MNAISIRDLRKSYGDVEAVRGISFDVPEGSFFAFLGPNGAGKSTTISVITSLARADSGTVEIFGRHPSDARGDIGVVFQDPKLDTLLTVRENIRVRASMYGIEGDSLEQAVSRAIETTGCTEFADRRYGNLSGGQRRRADIARALVHSPKLLILDEPTTGLDPKTRTLVWELVNRLNRENGMTVLLTTHYMEEAEGADMVTVINHGEIVTRGTPAEIREAHSRDRMVFEASDSERARSVLESLNIEFTENERVFTVPLGRTADSVPVITALGDLITRLEVRTGSLDEAFVNITGEEIE